MSKVATPRQVYQDGGVRAVLVGAWKHVLMHSRVSPLLQRLLGKRLHQKLYMHSRLGYLPNIREPRSFNEKTLHRKLFTEDDRFAMVEDKWRVREYVASTVGSEILPEVYHVTDDPGTIPFDDLPAEYVVKPTHMSGPIIFVNEDEDPRRERIRSRCREWLEESYGKLFCEYWYQDMEPRILVEERLRDEAGDVPRDFKFFVFHGRVEYVQVDHDRFSDHSRRYYDRDWNPQEFTTTFPLGPKIEEPELLNEMIDIAQELGEGFDFIRVDLFQLEDRIVFGELTVAHGSGGRPFEPREYDFEFGSHW